MNLKRIRYAALVAVGMLVFSFCPAAVAGALQSGSTTPAPSPLAAPVQAASEQEVAVFSADDMKAFVNAALKADKIRDPMKRCLNFPDPPGSHWSRDGLAASCRYNLQETISLAEFDRLIGSGHAKDLDKRFSSWDADSKRHPNAFYRFLVVRFGKAAPDRQPLIESWKQQSPRSAYAYALSGWNYMNIGWSARGGKPAAETADSSFDAMETEIERSRGDIEMAIRLDPHLSAPYAVMIDIGTLVSDPAYAAEGAEKGVTATRNRYPTFVQLARYTASRWHGDARSQQQLLARVNESIHDEPLLHVIRATVLCFEAEIDHQAPSDHQWSVYRTVLDDVASFSVLQRVGETALDSGQYALAYVYLSEAARFNPADQDVIDERARAASQMTLH